MRRKKHLKRKFITLFKNRIVFLSVLFLAGIAAWAFLIDKISEENVFQPINVDAKAAIIIEAKDGEVFFDKDPDKRYPPASTAKVMTAIVAIENAHLDKRIIPSREALRVEPTVAGLKPGISYKLKDLLAAILIKSANDAAQAIAEGVAGSQQDFVVLMNEKAVRIGMENTYFANPSGLPTARKDSQHTTARDLAKMMKYASRYKIILELMSKSEKSIYGSDKKEIYLRTHNKSLLRYDDAPWGKTGYTIEARRTFVGTDPALRPRIVFALLKSDELWADIMILKREGLQLYKENNRTFLSDLFRWLKEQRSQGIRQVQIAEARK